MKYILFILINIYYVFDVLFYLTMLQQNSYNDKHKYFNFIACNIKDNITFYFLKILFPISLLLFNELNPILYIYFYVILFILIYSSILNYKNYNKKLPLRFTKRLIRIFSLDVLFYILIGFFSYKLNLLKFISYMLLYTSLNYLILILIIFILKPIELIIFNRYKKKALDKLNKMNDIKIIGITGSFGKTSTKMILNDILNVKYKGFCTPKSFNTPNGILKSINEEKTIFNDYFICEMGARKVGEIKYLCNLVKPKYGIITSIGACHLETFKTIENILKTKFELADFLPSDGILILNKDDEYIKKYKFSSKAKVYYISLNEKADAYAKNIKITSEGTSFDLYIKDEKINVKTSLLGQKNIYNILSSSLMAYLLGLSLKEIKKGISNIKPISHRLEIKKVNNLTIIDDSYNSNPIGAKNALEVLSLMKGEKIIITPGMVEMGKEEENLNYNFGKDMANICDKFYLIGKKRSKPIIKGILEINKNADIKVFNKFDDAYNDVIKGVKRKNVTLLIENDLPDLYLEK